MEQLQHDLWIARAVNALLGPVAAAILRLFGYEVPPGAKVIPDHLVMLIVITGALTVACLVIRSRLSVERPGSIQLLLEDFVALFHGLLEDLIGPKGRRYLPLVGTVFLLIWVSNMSGLVPGLMAPTSNMNVTLGCALTVWVYYHIQGVKEQGLGPYLKHFVLPPGTPLAMAPLMLLIEPVSHLSRVLSLSLRLFGNIFGEELIILIIASIIPFIAPLPMMFLGLLTGTLQAAIFAMLTMVYLGGAVAVEHHDSEPGHAH